MARMPQVTAQDLVRFLKSQGFIEDRQAGSHLTLWDEKWKGKDMGSEVFLNSSRPYRSKLSSFLLCQNAPDCLVPLGMPAAIFKIPVH